MKTTVEKDWTTAAGLRAVVLMTTMGHRCGYVAVHEGHPLHGVNYGDACDALPSAENEELGKRGIISALTADSRGYRSPDVVFDVHGSLTYWGGDNSYPALSFGAWWFGYDCGHSGDAPCDEYGDEMRERYPDKSYMWERDGIHRTLEYCVRECESLAAQIVEKTMVPA